MSFPPREDNEYRTTVLGTGEVLISETNSDKQQICQKGTQFISPEVKHAEFHLSDCFSRHTHGASYQALWQGDEPVCYGFLEKVHSIPVCFWLKT